MSQRKKPFQSRGFLDALELLERRCKREGYSLRDRAQVKNAILGAIEAAICDAHMSGRVYERGGSVRDPGSEHAYMTDRAHRAAMVAYRREMEEWK